LHQTCDLPRPDAAPEPAVHPAHRPGRRRVGGLLALLFTLALSTVGALAVGEPASATPTNTAYWPLSGGVTSRIGPRDGGWHDGIDIGANIGTEVRAIQGGVIVQIVPAASGGSAGNYLSIDHGNGYYSRYLHLNGFNGMQVGWTVSRGDVIGHSGQTGCRAPCAHLHLEMRTGSGPNLNQSTAIDFDNAVGSSVTGGHAIPYSFGGLAHWIPANQAVSPGPNAIGLAATKIRDASGARSIAGVLWSNSNGCLALISYSSGTPTLVAQQNTAAGIAAFSLGSYAGGYFTGTLDWSPLPCGQNPYWHPWVGFGGGHRYQLNAGTAADVWVN
jgi:hypothetical protein